jgi:hypothetical protein
MYKEERIEAEDLSCVIIGDRVVTIHYKDTHDFVVILAYDFPAGLRITRVVYGDDNIPNRVPFHRP